MNEEFPKDRINPYKHYRKTRELYEKYPELHGKILTSLMDWRGNHIYVISDVEYPDELWIRHYQQRGESNLTESMGAEIKENPMSLR